MHAATVLILDASPFLAAWLQHGLATAYPAARCLCATNILGASEILSQVKIDLLLTGLDASGGDVLDLLVHVKRKGRPPAHTFVATGAQGVRGLLTLRWLGVLGVLNLQDEPQQLGVALTTVERGQTYWSASYSAALFSHDAQLVLRQLSPAEQLGLAMLGDGCSDKTALDRIGMSLSSIRSLRRDLYAKLNVHDKEGLQRAAARLGFTRASAAGAVPTGAAMLVVEYIERSKRPISLPASLLDQCGFMSPSNAFGSSPPFKRAG
jgi:DNA-binding NarL/FixJ family response regulator